MAYHHSQRMTLRGSHTIVVDARPVPPGITRRVYILNSRLMAHFSRYGIITAEWMPYDHIIDLTQERPCYRFEVEGRDHWYVVSELSEDDPPLVCLDSGMTQSISSQTQAPSTWDVDDIDDESII